jgi:Phosphotransferase enzyme family
MLETTLATTFTPGTNLKGQVAGANWSFLLPNLELDQVLCLGLPPTTTLTTLARMSRSVEVVGADAKVLPGAQKRVAEFSNITFHTIHTSLALPLVNQSVDLLLIAEHDASEWIRRGHPLTTELHRLLKPDALVYYEYTGLRDPLEGSDLLHSLLPGNQSAQRFWLTPLAGEMHTATPLTDQRMIEYFMQNRFYSSTNVVHRWLKQVGKMVGGSRRKGSVRAQKAIASKNSKVRHSNGSWKSTLRTLVRGASGSLLTVADYSQTFVDQQALNSRWLQRQGVLLHRKSGASGEHPPLYLQTLARAADIDLSNHRWGLMARGDYSSRKLIFFLFDQNRAQGNETPQCIVKMVRDATFNARLENESRALTWLEEHGIGDEETLPRVLFAGRHANLAIVGESVIHGHPFRQKSQATADCPYARQAIDWLTELGAATADSRAVAPGQVAAGLQRLFQQFVAIYHPTAEERDFLAGQIAQIEQCPQPIPLVFQHGDPGSWNALVTPTGRVAFLDWEAAEVQGMPLWDLYYFLRSYCVGAARAQGAHDPLAGFAQHVLDDKPLGRLFAQAVETYCERTNLAPALAGPLFYTCWMHRSLKEATRLTANQMESGHYMNLLRMSIQKRHLPIPSRLFD